MNTVDNGADIYNDIHHVTHIPYENRENVPRFVALKKPGRGERDRLMNLRPLRPPRNIELVEGDSADMEARANDRLDMRDFPNDHQLLSQIRAVSGLDYSNQFIEQHWRSSNSPSVSTSPKDSSESPSMTPPANASSSSDVPETSSSLIEHSTFSCNTDCETSVIHNETDDWNKKINDKLAVKTHDILRNCWYSRNALIQGLLKNNLITREDLDLNTPSEADIEEEPQPLNSVQEIAGGPTFNNTTLPYCDEDENSQNFDYLEQSSSPEALKWTKNPTGDELRVLQRVPHPEDPEVFVHPLQAYGQVNDQGIDFSIERLGTKEITTSRKYFINSVDDSFFEFERRKPRPTKKVMKNGRSGVSPSEAARSRK